MPTSDLIAAFRALLADGSDGNRLVASRGPAWFVASAAKGDKSVLVEAAPSSCLPKDRGLSPARIRSLRRAGFANRPGERCLGRHVSVDRAGALESLCLELEALFAEVYGEPDGPTDVALSLGDRDQTENPLLIEAMRKMAKSRDHGQRTQLYRALLDARLLLVTDSDGAPRKVDELVGYDVYAAFTSFSALRRWEPRGATFRVTGGRDLYPQLMNTKVGSLLIDPKSPVGGELYRNEVETLAGASHRRVRVR